MNRLGSDPFRKKAKPAKKKFQKHSHHGEISIVDLWRTFTYETIPQARASAYLKILKVFTKFK